MARREEVLEPSSTTGTSRFLTLGQAADALANGIHDACQARAPGGHLVQQRLQVVVAVAADGGHQHADRRRRRTCHSWCVTAAPPPPAGPFRRPCATPGPPQASSTRRGRTRAPSPHRARECSRWSAARRPVGSNRRTTTRRPSSASFIAGIWIDRVREDRPGSGRAPATGRERHKRHRRLEMRGRLAVDGVEARPAGPAFSQNLNTCSPRSTRVSTRSWRTIGVTSSTGWPA
ncbi:MAG: hypothetical protein MZV64_43085 [Ignavibacteriales bacterium]|nr:hypothetical protein [Ignavibacteriales bacterium]